MKKRILSVFIVFAMVISLVPVTAIAEVATTPTTRILPNFIAPIELIDPDCPEMNWIAISDRAGLEAMANNLSGNFYLTADIDLGGMEWIPIGGYSFYERHFRGTLDGQGYIIRNLTVTKLHDVWGQGLFGNVWNAVIKNVGLEDTNININTKISACDDENIGSLVGYAQGDTVIYNCYNTGSISGNFEVIRARRGDDNDGHVIIGGLVGSGGNINNSYNTADISLEARGSLGSHSIGAAGIRGSGCGGSITNCYNTGDITVRGEHIFAVGGIAVSNSVQNSAPPVDINACYNVGNIYVYSHEPQNYHVNIRSVGGIVGFLYGKLNNCYSTGLIFINGNAIDDKLVGRENWNLGINNSYSYIDGVGMIGTNVFTTEQMQQQSSFEGFDFDRVWTFIEGENNGMPVLWVFHDFSHATIPEPPMPPFTPSIAEGNPTIGDALEILKYLAKLPNDINNGVVSPTIGDALEVLKKLAGLPSVFDTSNTTTSPPTTTTPPITTTPTNQESILPSLHEQIVLGYSQQREIIEHIQYLGTYNNSGVVAFIPLSGAGDAMGFVTVAGFEFVYPDTNRILLWTPTNAYPGGAFFHLGEPYMSHIGIPCGFELGLITADEVAEIHRRYIESGWETGNWVHPDDLPGTTTPAVVTATLPITTPPPATQPISVTTPTPPQIQYSYNANFSNRWRYNGHSNVNWNLNILQNKHDIAEKLSLLPNSVGFAWSEDWNDSVVVTFTFHAGIGGLPTVNEAKLVKINGRWIIEHSWELNSTVRGEPMAQMMYFVVPRDVFGDTDSVAYSLNGIIAEDAVVTSQEAITIAEEYAQGRFPLYRHSGGTQIVKYPDNELIVAYKIEGRYWNHDLPIHPQHTNANSKVYIYVDVMTGEALGHNSVVL